MYLRRVSDVFGRGAVDVFAASRRGFFSGSSRKFRPHPVLAPFVKEGVKESDYDKILGRRGIQNSPRDVVVLGGSGVGKSAVSNGLLGCDVVPSGVNHTTQGVTRVGWGTDYSVNGRIVSEPSFPAEVRKRAGSAQPCEISVPGDGVTEVIDTPGLDESGKVQEHLEALHKESKRPTILLCVERADMEKLSLKKFAFLKERQKIFVFTHADVLAQNCARDCESKFNTHTAASSLINHQEEKIRKQVKNEHPDAIVVFLAKQDGVNKFYPPLLNYLAQLIEANLDHQEAVRKADAVRAFLDSREKEVYKYVSNMLDANMDSIKDAIMQLIREKETIAMNGFLEKFGSNMKGILERHHRQMSPLPRTKAAFTDELFESSKEEIIYVMNETTAQYRDSMKTALRHELSVSVTPNLAQQLRGLYVNAHVIPPFEQCCNLVLGSIEQCWGEPAKFDSKGKHHSSWEHGAWGAFVYTAVLVLTRNPWWAARAGAASATASWVGESIFSPSDVIIELCKHGKEEMESLLQKGRERMEGSEGLEKTIRHAVETAQEGGLHPAIVEELRAIEQTRSFAEKKCQDALQKVRDIEKNQPSVSCLHPPRVLRSCEDLTEALRKVEELSMRNA
uniref:G domain-containing protein n=1 Tax=Chromera velia CCMP2878 TaxID=1169474 RepID=A0A0G4F7M6_9ALVE|eukprot:Cvel_15637.t1-p1 / transcript=Cvel_15637.t1 / gene=Cvel_15637 / organism=Chromera_velia_CCMP2878 / gene_product=hypothetical protein / transcript_product=hypothetical protein / location=Cvel_scaffold1165:30705-32849(+) / protein_length=619 / sequence_SO=supercontig / SO=protein_coding / is_pseudo=false